MKHVPEFYSQPRNLQGPRRAAAIERILNLQTSSRGGGWEGQGGRLLEHWLDFSSVPGLEATR